LTPASSPLPREPNARRESNSSCASLHREKQGEVWPRHSIGHHRFDGGLAALPASSSQPDPAKLTEVDLEDIVSFITCDSRDPSPSDAMLERGVPSQEANNVTLTEEAVESRVDSDHF
jgi:hypothetical protein